MSMPEVWWGLHSLACMLPLYKGISAVYAISPLCCQLNNIISAMYVISHVCCQLNGVLAVHELHVWQLTGNRVIASGHICCHNLQEYMALATKIKQLFHDHGIHSTTIQPEFTDVAVSIEELKIRLVSLSLTKQLWLKTWTSRDEKC